MNLVQAWEALLDGKCIKVEDTLLDGNNIIYKLDENNYKKCWYYDNKNWEDSFFTSMCDDNTFEIVEDPAIEQNKENNTKTIDLNIFEAYEALKEGHCIQPENYFVHQYKDGELYYWNASGVKCATETFSAHIYKRFSIVSHPDDQAMGQEKEVVENNKELSFVDALDLIISARKPVKSSLGLITRVTKHVDIADICFLDLVERRGGSITED